MMKREDIPTPAAVIDLAQVDENIRVMVEESGRYGIAHRPHSKVHKCAAIAKRQLALGAKGITCAKLSEAEVMAEAGIDDILLAFPLIGREKYERYARLAQRAKMTTIVNSIEGAAGLSAVGEGLLEPLRVLIEIDGGTRRGGLTPGEPTLAFARSIRDRKGISICGLMCYYGSIYDNRTESDIVAAVEKERGDILDTAALLRMDGFEMEVLSAGNSFSGKRPRHLEGVTETRAGNYLFNDCTQLALGMVSEKQCALRVLATVVAKPDERHAIIDAGSKTLSSDTCRYREGRGWIVGHPELRIPKLNEEHGFVEGDEALPFGIGDRIEIIPNHACVITNLCGMVFGIDAAGEAVPLTIDGRARNY